MMRMLRRMIQLLHDSNSFCPVAITSHLISLLFLPALSSSPSPSPLSRRALPQSADAPRVCWQFLSSALSSTLSSPLSPSQLSATVRVMSRPSILHVSTPTGESHIRLGHVIQSTPRSLHLALSLHNTASEPTPLTFHLCHNLSHFFVITALLDHTHPNPDQRHFILNPHHPLAHANRNLIYDYSRPTPVLRLPAHSRRVIRLVLTTVVTTVSSATLSPDSSFQGHLKVCHAQTQHPLASISVSGTTAEPCIQTDQDLLDFGLCPVGVSVYRHFSVTNLTNVPARFSLSLSFRPSTDPSHRTQLRFEDPLMGFELDPNLVHVEPSSERRVRVVLLADAPGPWDRWLAVQNLDNTSNFLHIHLIAKSNAERIAERLFVSCGADLDFGDCYVNFHTFKDIIVQSNYDEDVTITLLTDRPSHLTFEVIHEWGVESEDLHRNVSLDATGRRVRSAVYGDENTIIQISRDDADIGAVRRQSSCPTDSPASLNDATSQGNSSFGAAGSHQVGIPYFSSQREDRDQRVESGLPNGVARKKSRLPETALLHPGQKKTIRVWYLPSTRQRSPPSEVRDSPNFDPGQLQHDSFLLAFTFPSGKSRTVIAHSRVCESILRLEQNEVHLGNCNVLTKYRTVLSLINCSDLPAHASITYVSQCVVADSHTLCIPPRETFDLGLNFIPRQVNPDYHKEVTISNLRNPKTSNLVFTLKADCVDDQGISLHALFYRIHAPHPTNEIDFGVTVANHPAIRAIKVRNITAKRLVLQFDGCPSASLYVPSTSLQTPIRCNPDSLSHDPWNRPKKASQTRHTGLVRDRTYHSVASASFPNTYADVIVDKRLSQEWPRRSSPDTSIPIWSFSSRPFSLQSPWFAWSAITSSEKDNETRPKRERKSAGYFSPDAISSDDLSVFDGQKMAMLDSMPTFFSNYDSERKYIDQQFRPKEKLHAALRSGHLTSSRTLFLEAGSESNVVISLTPTDSDVRNKTKIRPIERILSVRMLDFDGGKLADLAETSSKQMHDIAKVFKDGHVSMPRDVVLTVRACKSRMRVAPLRQLNFGAIACGEQKDKAFTLVNLSEAPLLYEIRKTWSSTRGDIRINLGKGAQGVVRPYFTKVVPFIFSPSCEGKYEERIVVENRLDNSANCVLIVKAQIS